MGFWAWFLISIGRIVKLLSFNTFMSLTGHVELTSKGIKGYICGHLLNSRQN